MKWSIQCPYFCRPGLQPGLLHVDKSNYNHQVEKFLTLTALNPKILSKNYICRGVCVRLKKEMLTQRVATKFSGNTFPAGFNTRLIHLTY